MKIEIDELMFNDTLLDLVDALVRAKLKDIIEDTTEYQMPEDTNYYTKLKLAAKVLHNHFAYPIEYYDTGGNDE